MIIKTRLPRLPYESYGKAISLPKCSSERAGPRSHPRTDLTTLTHWDKFYNEIHQAISEARESCDLTTNNFDIDGWTRDSVVECEEKLRSHAEYALHVPVEIVSGMLGVEGSFRMPGNGNAAIIGSPDFSWIVHPATMPHPILVVEYKPWWVVDLTRVLAAFSSTDSDYMDKQTLEAIEQIYGYMTFNNTKYGILTTWTHAMFLRRVETADRKHLEYFVVDLEGPSSSTSMLKAWVGMVLIAYKFHALPTVCLSPSNRRFAASSKGIKEQDKVIEIAKKFNAKPIRGTYNLLDLDFRLCQFDLSSARERANGSIVLGRLQSATDSLNTVVFRVIDACRNYPDATEHLQVEANIYATLYDLQGQVIPTIYGFYKIWGILHVLAMQPVGTALCESVVQPSER